ncbi:TonB-linked outer membrane protein, SusC/RagA family [bacterium A37T11]|nr:TonB-linked outer membrane protein, SusC/RagA family [bacterium A37T11]
MKNNRANKGILSFLLTAIFIGWEAMAFGQRVSVNLDRASMETFLTTLQQQTDVALLFNEQLVANKIVSVKAKDVDIKDLLKSELPKYGLSYRVSNNQITIIPAAQSEANIVSKIGDVTKQVQVLLSVKGRVFDNSQPPSALSSVTVAEQGTTNAVVTDESGSFSIKVPKGATLTFSSVGLQTKQLVISKNEPSLTVTLTDEVSELNEIVVVGYGVQKKASVTGSVASIQSKDLVKVKTASVTNMLAGRLPGLRAVQRSGAPGDDGASIDIRGYGGMLVIVDGVERGFSELDANDIESISILKDAAAAVYGFKGSNGVLLVTTKKGSETKTKLEYNGYYGVQDVTRYPRMMNAYEYAALYNEAIYNTNPWTGVPAYTNEQLAAYKNGSVGTDWWDEMVQPAAPQSSHNLSVYGGNDKVNFYNSVGYLSQQGILRSNDWNFDRYNIRSNITVNVTKDFSVDLKLSGRYEKRDKPFDSDNLFRQAQVAVPIFSIYANENPNYWQAVGDMANPIHTSYSENAGYENRYRREFNSSLTFNWKLPWVVGLNAKAMVAYDYENSEWKTWQKALNEYTFDASSDTYNEVVLRNLSTLESKQQNYYKPTQQYSLNYNHLFGDKHDVSGMLLWELYNDQTTWVTGYRQFALGLIDNLDYGDAINQTSGGNTTSTAHAGLVGRFNYAYDSRYLLEFSFREDGSYKFQSDRRWGFFPGISLGWRASEESFFKRILPDVDNFKIRGSYAKVGDEGSFDAYQYLEGYTYSGSYVLGDGGLSTGLSSSGLANPWLTWYVSKIMNLGFEGSYKHGLLTAEFDWFRRDRSGLPATRQATLPTIFGESMPQENLNSDLNTGFEISIGHKNKIGQLAYNVTANFSTTRIKNKYVERAVPTNMYDNYRNNTNDRNTGIQWGREVIGQFTSYEDILNSPIQDNNGNKSLLPGDLKFKDVNNDGIIDNNDQAPIGRGTTPTMYYGLNLGVDYKGFDFNLFFQGGAGHDVYISGDVLDPFIQQGLGNGFAFMTDRWHREDPTDPSSPWIPGLMPAARITGQADNRSQNSYTLHDAAYLRLKSLELGYTFPTTWFKQIGLEKVRVYFNGNNLLTFTGKEGLMKYIDPENNDTSLRYYPQLKTYNLGINVIF